MNLRLLHRTDRYHIHLHTHAFITLLPLIDAKRSQKKYLRRRGRKTPEHIFNQLRDQLNLNLSSPQSKLSDGTRILSTTEDSSWSREARRKKTQSFLYQTTATYHSSLIHSLEDTRERKRKERKRVEKGSRELQSESQKKARESRGVERRRRERHMPR